jgi:hypothetical protein
MFEKSNRFSVEIYYGYKKILYLKFVNNEYKIIEWLRRKNIEWTNINFYDRKSGVFLFQKTSMENEQILAIKKEQNREKI